MSLPVVLPILNTEVASSPRKFKHRLDLDNLDDLEFYQRFKLRKGTFWFVMDEIRSDLSRTSQSSTAASPEIQLLCALRFYSTGGFLNLIGDSMGVDITPLSAELFVMCLSVYLTDWTNMCISLQIIMISWINSTILRNFLEL